jgi:hypothetical protein
MAQKPENAFIAGVHKHLPPVKTFHREKMNNPYSSGTADVWYSSVFDLWVEYKYIQKLPVRVPVPVDLSELQKDWLERRYREGRNVWVIVGFNKGGVILQDLQWELPMSVAVFVQRAVDRKIIATSIIRECGGLTLY